MSTIGLIKSVLGVLYPSNNESILSLIPWGEGMDSALFQVHDFQRETQSCKKPLNFLRAKFSKSA